MLTRSNNAPSAERPVLRLGLAGFTTAEQSSLNIALALRAAKYQMNWQLAQLGDADAWCVNGSRVSALPDGTLRIVPGLPSGRSIRINPAEIDWPVAFSTPLAAPDFKPTYLFQPNSPESIASMLTQLEGWLRPLMVQFHLASYIVEKNIDLRSRVFHVSVNGKLYALLSRRAGIGVWPLADPGEMRNAVWNHRPGMADDIPGYFVRTDFSQLMWQYATRTTRDCLPPHYRTRRPVPASSAAFADAPAQRCEPDAGERTRRHAGHLEGTGATHRHGRCAVVAPAGSALYGRLHHRRPQARPGTPVGRGRLRMEFGIRLDRSQHSGRVGHDREADIGQPATAAGRPN